MSKTVKTRIINRHDTEANWNDVKDSFIPEKGELIIYDFDGCERFKIGDGKTTVGTLPFADITREERNKLSAEYLTPDCNYDTISLQTDKGLTLNSDNGAVSVQNLAFTKEGNNITAIEGDVNFTGNVLVDGTLLENKFQPPTVNNGTLTIQKNGTNVATFSANQSGNTTANIVVPTGAAADKGVDTSISKASTSTNLPTSQAVAAFVEGKGYKTTDNNTTYTITTGDSNGQIKVTTSSGATYNVSVNGLGTAAYTSSNDYLKSVPVAGASVVGGFKTGYMVPSASLNIPVALDNNSKAYAVVNPMAVGMALSVTGAKIPTSCMPYAKPGTLYNGAAGADNQRGTKGAVRVVISDYDLYIYTDDYTS